jgi:hypothetical protein
MLQHPRNLDPPHPTLYHTFMQQPPAPSPSQTLTRLARRFLIALLVAALLWSFWYAYAAAQLRARIAHYRAQGEPALPIDLVGKPLPPDDNGYLLLTQAGDTLHLTPEEQEFVDPLTSLTPTMLPLSNAQMAIAQHMIAAHADVLQLIDRACRASGIACPTDPSDLVKSADLRHLGRFRALANFLRAVLLFHHQSGHDDLVANDLQQIQVISDITANGHYLIHGLVAIAISDLASRTLLHIAPDFQLASPSTPHGMPRHTAAHLSESFLDAQPLLNTFRLSLEGERLFAMAAGESFDRRTFLLRPMFRLDALRAAANWDATLNALGTTPDNYHNFASSPTPPPAPSTTTNLWLAAHLVSVNTHDIQLYGAHYYHDVANRTAAGLRLAIRLYELDHAGTFPPTLASLQPHYLKTLPLDPFAPTPHTFLYIPERHLFYSVGKNELDDGAPVTPNTLLPDWQAPDAVYPLTR